VAADKASAQDAEILGVQVGAPVQRKRSLCYDAAGQVIEYGESLLPAEHETVFVYAIRNTRDVGEE